MNAEHLPLRCLIRTDGTVVPLEHKTSMHRLHKLIGAEVCDTVRLRDSRGLVMIIDDMGWETKLVQREENHFELEPVRALKPLNARATALYKSVCQLGTTHQIVGDVAIVPDEDFAP